MSQEPLPLSVELAPQILNLVATCHKQYGWEGDDHLMGFEPQREAERMIDARVRPLVEALEKLDRMASQWIQHGHDDAKPLAYEVFAVCEDTFGRSENAGAARASAKLRS